MVKTRILLASILSISACNVIDHQFARQDIQNLQDVKKYSINLMWINKTSDQDRKFISSAKDEQELIEKIIDPVCKWAKANPEAEVVLWYDSVYVSPKAVSDTQFVLQNVLVLKECSRLQMRDIRTIPIVHKNPDVFSDQTPFYFRIDLLKPIIVVDSIERGGNDAAIYTDLEVGNLRKDGSRMGKNELFKNTVMNDLAHFGLVLGIDGLSKLENQFLQLVRNSRMIESIKHVIVNPNLIRAVAVLNWKDRYRIPLINSAVFSDTVQTVFQYYQATAEGKPVEVLGELVDPNAKEGEWIEYRPRKHGYLPLGLDMDRSGLRPLSEFKGKYLEVRDMLKLPFKYDTGKRDDLDVKGGIDHFPYGSYVSGKAVSEDGVYRYQLMD